MLCLFLKYFNSLHFDLTSHYYVQEIRMGHLVRQGTETCWYWNLLVLYT